MIVDQKLNFVVPVPRPGGTLYVHSMPLMKETFERYYLILAKTYNAILDNGVGIGTGPRVAYLMMRDIAQKDGSWAGDEGVELGLLAEIRRLSSMISMTDAGWKSVPFEEAVRRKVLDEDEESEVLGLIVFFTVVSAIERRGAKSLILTFAAKMWGAQTSFSNSTEFAASLGT